MYRNHYSDIIVTNQNDKTQRSDNPVFPSRICTNVIYVCHFNLSRTDRSSKYFFIEVYYLCNYNNHCTLFRSICEKFTQKLEIL